MKDGCLPAGTERRIACKNRKWRQVAGKRINELEDKLRGKIKQQIDPAFSITETDGHFHVTEGAVSKISIVYPHAPSFQTTTCSVIAFNQQDIGGVIFGRSEGCVCAHICMSMCVYARTCSSPC